MTQETDDQSETLDRMVEILARVSSVRSPDRALAVSYTECRAKLLSGGLAPKVPGFLLQCVSVSKFHDFINLYAPGLPERLEFIEASFQGCRKAPESGGRRDIFGEEAF